MADSWRCSHCGRRSERVSLGQCCFHCGRKPSKQHWWPWVLFAATFAAFFSLVVRW
jgi:hypothetical protein